MMSAFLTSKSDTIKYFCPSFVAVKYCRSSKPTAFPLTGGITLAEELLVFLFLYSRGSWCYYQVIGNVKQNLGGAMNHRELWWRQKAQHLGKQFQSEHGVGTEKVAYCWNHSSEWQNTGQCRLVNQKKRKGMIWNLRTRFVYKDSSPSKGKSACVESQ